MTTSNEFAWQVRVYYEDTDAGGVVFYANYLKFFERARTEWLRSAGIDHTMMAETEGILFIIKSTSIDYHAPAKLDDELKLSAVVEHRGHASLQFLQHAWRLKGEAPVLLATGRIKVACVNARDFRPCKFPAALADKIALNIAKYQ